VTLEARLRQVLADVLEIDPGAISEGTSPQTIEAWDSVAHLNLVLALESEFGVQFDAEEIPELVSFQILRDRLSELEQQAS
jgi:acyl carrier protein